MTQSKPSLYLISILFFMLILPVSFIVFQWKVSKQTLDWLLIGKWFLFWSVGLRLFIAGIRQVLKPAFTAQEIFHIRGEESFVVIRELGFANISIGLTAIISMSKPS